MAREKARLKDIAAKTGYGVNTVSLALRGSTRISAAAREIIEQASRDVELIHAECRFHRVPGRLYHLYERAGGHRFFSMLGPDEYGGAGPSGFVASYRYEHDESWTRLDEVEGRDRRRSEIQGFVSNRLLGASDAHRP